MDFRAITVDEIEPFYAVFWRTMGFGPPQEAYVEREQRSFCPERSVAAFDAGSIVGTTYSHLFELTLPGGAIVPAAGVTAVCASSTHRRRGIVTELMRRQLTEARERGEPAAILLASEGKIYNRFGYGPATHVIDAKIDTKEAVVQLGEVVGRVTMVDGDTADKVFPEVHDAARRARAGSIGRPPHFWESATADRDKKHVHVLYESAAGDATGYLRYGVSAEWSDGGIPAHKLTVHDFTAVDDAATLELWRFLLTLDLVREVTAMSRPVDDPLRWVLAEPRAYRSTSYRDMLWLRPLDVPRLLSSRSYNTNVELTLEVVDPFLGLGGTFTLEMTTEGGECRQSTASPDVTLDISQLGSVLLGGVPLTALHRAGRIGEATPGAVALADLAFRDSPTPWGNTYF